MSFRARKVFGTFEKRTPAVYFDARFLSLSVVLQPTEIVVFTNIFLLLRVQRKDPVGRSFQYPTTTCNVLLPLQRIHLLPLSNTCLINS